MGAIAISNTWLFRVVSSAFPTVINSFPISSERRNKIPSVTNDAAITGLLIEEIVDDVMVEIMSGLALDDLYRSTSNQFSLSQKICVVKIVDIVR